MRHWRRVGILPACPCSTLSRLPTSFSCCSSFLNHPSTYLSDLSVAHSISFRFMFEPWLAKHAARRRSNATVSDPSAKIADNEPVTVRTPAREGYVAGRKPTPTTDVVPSLRMIKARVSSTWASGPCRDSPMPTPLRAMFNKGRASNLPPVQHTACRMEPSGMTPNQIS